MTTSAKPPSRSRRLVHILEDTPEWPVLPDNPTDRDRANTYVEAALIEQRKNSYLIELLEDFYKSLRDVQRRLKLTHAPPWVFAAILFVLTLLTGVVIYATFRK